VDRAARLFPTLLVLALLIGTAAAFAVTERLKLVPTPIVGPKVTEAFSPVCGCATEKATIAFTLRESDRVSVTVVDDDGRAVEELADDEPRGAGRVTYVWSGRGSPEGTYRARVHLAEARRTIVIPNKTRLDTTAPVLTVQSIVPDVFSPDRDGRSDKVKATYSVSERSSVLLFVDGRRALEHPPSKRAKLDWYGKRLPPGLYAVTLVARDLAGNRSQPSPTAVVRLRFIALARRRLVVPAGVRFGVGVSTDARRYAWRLGRERGTAAGRRLVLRAPLTAGRYTLSVSYRGHRDAAAIFVRPK
jgi:hypothetical protein